MRTLIAAVAIALSVFGANAYADDASKKAMTEELLQVMKSEQMMKDMYDQSRGMAERLFPEINATPTQSAVIKKFRNRLYDILNDTMSWQSLKPEIVAIYTETFTEEEIQAMLVFYRSPAGQAIVDKMPKVTMQSMVIVQKRMPEMQRQLKILLEEMMQELKDNKEENG